MEKQMTLEANAFTAKGFTAQMKRISYRLAAPQRMLRRYYAYVLGEEVSKERARAMTEAQAAFFAVTLPADYPLVLRALACAWFVVAIRKLNTHPRPPEGRELN